jgi:uncharacterized protein involved in oxidation of intracellular sulfur
MASILFAGSFGSDDPTRATLPFLGALGGVNEGHETSVALVGEAVMLMKDVIAEQVHGVGWPPLADLLSQTIDNGIPIYI